MLIHLLRNLEVRDVNDVDDLLQQYLRPPLPAVPPPMNLTPAKPAGPGRGRPKTTKFQADADI